MILLSLSLLVSDAAAEGWKGPTLQAPPRSIPVAGGGSVEVRAPVVRGIDYPPLAMRKGIEGDTILRLRVSADGRLTSCETVHTAGLPDLDVQACNLLRKRASFRVVGRKDAAVFELPVQWRLEK